MSQNARMNAIFGMLPPEAKEALGFMGDLATLQREHESLRQEVIELRTLREQLNENLSRVMKRDGELLQEVRDLHDTLSKILLSLYTDGMGDAPVYVQALAHATRDLEWCTACNGNHAVLLSDADLYVLCPKVFPHRKARGY